VSKFETFHGHALNKVFLLRTAFEAQDLSQHWRDGFDLTQFLARPRHVENSAGSGIQAPFAGSSEPRVPLRSNRVAWCKLEDRPLAKADESLSFIDGEHRKS